MGPSGWVGRGWWGHKGGWVGVVGGPGVDE